jgi:hypothetical protein
VRWVCDACGRPVEFSVTRRDYRHLELTNCPGIDGIVLGVRVSARTEVPDLPTSLTSSREEIDERNLHS